MNVPTRFPFAFAMLGITALVSCTGTDGKLNVEDTVPAACTGPVANAGADQNVANGGLTTLDGSGSALCDGSAPGYVWTLETVPTDSTIDAGDISLTDPAHPTFTPDSVGAFVFSLVITDAEGNPSPADLVVINVGASSSKPIADCGGNLTAEVMERVDLNGSRSSDPEGAALSYQWTLSAVPDCSALTNGDIYNGTTANAALVPDCASVFVVALAVNDGESWSDPAYCSVTVGSGNQAPIADAGSTQALSPCTEHHYELNGYGSYDPEGAPITYQWSMISAPAGSTSTTASFNNPTLPNPAFEWDIPGEYTFALQVNDGAVTSPPDVVVLTFHDVTENAVPIANAGADETINKEPECETASYVFTCEDCPAEDVTLDGTASDDPVDGDDLQFRWTEPTGELTLESPNSATTRAVTPSYPSERNVALVNSWTVDLAVSDCADTVHDTVTVTYTCTGTY